MAKYWHYYDQNGVKCGPIHSSALRVLAAQGVVAPETTLETESGKQAPAGMIEGLTFGLPAPVDGLALHDDNPAPQPPPAIPPPASVANPAPESAPAATPPPSQSAPLPADQSVPAPQRPASPSKVGVFLSKAWAWFNRQSPKTKTAIVVGFVLLTGIACVQAAMEERRKAEEAAYRREVYNSPEARAERAAKLEALRNRLIAERREKRGKAWEEVVGRELMIRIFATLVDGKGEDDQHCAQCNVIIKEILAIFMLRLESGDMTARRGDLWAEQAAQNAYSAFIEEYIPVGIRLDAEYLCGAKREPAPIDMVGLR